jgi:hypothetical protein
VNAPKPAETFDAIATYTKCKQYVDFVEKFAKTTGLEPARAADVLARMAASTEAAKAVGDAAPALTETPETSKAIH